MTESARLTVSLLRDLYLETLDRCRPDVMLRAAFEDERVSLGAELRSILALGKCAAPLAVEAAKLTGITRGLVIHPKGYGGEVMLPAGFERIEGAHPVPTRASQSAARRAIEFVSAQQHPLLFLVSGGASACMEGALSPVSFEEVVRVNELLLASGWPIGEINTVRRHLSSVKGGRLGALAPPDSHTLVYSDVPPGQPTLVGSGPTAADPSTLDEAAAMLDRLDDPLAAKLARALRSGDVAETIKVPPTRLEVIADSESLVAAATTEAGLRNLGVVRGPSLDGDVVEVASRLADAVASLEAGEVLVTAGEPTVIVTGDGVGGRCSELAARFVLDCDARGVHDTAGVFGSSDGRDGLSPAAAVLVSPSNAPRLDGNSAAEAFARSASYELVATFGEPIMMVPTGNNLRDVAFLIRTTRLPG